LLNVKRNREPFHRQPPGMRLLMRLLHAAEPNMNREKQCCSEPANSCIVHVVDPWSLRVPKMAAFPCAGSPVNPAAPLFSAPGKRSVCAHPSMPLLAAIERGLRRLLLLRFDGSIAFEIPAPPLR
jgi:hypothetical protein